MATFSQFRKLLTILQRWNIATLYTDQQDVPAGQTGWMDQLDGPAGRTSWTDQLDGPAGRTSWTEKLDRPGPAGWTSSLYLKPWLVRLFED